MRIQRSYDEFFYMREEKTAFSASAAASPLMDLKDQTRTLWFTKNFHFLDPNPKVISTSRDLFWGSSRHDPLCPT